VYIFFNSLFVCLFVGKLTKIENVGQRFDKIAASVPCVIPYMNVNTCHLSSTLLNSFVQYFTARYYGRECILDTVEIQKMYVENAEYTENLTES
jgi:hypothetical protein